MTNHHPTYISHDVVSQNQHKVGTVTDVVYDDAGDQPKWLVVKPGLLRAERFVPIEGSYQADDGNIVVPFDKRSITAAPAARDHVLSRQKSREIAEHYDVDA